MPIFNQSLDLAGDSKKCLILRPRLNSLLNVSEIKHVLRDLMNVDTNKRGTRQMILQLLLRKVYTITKVKLLEKFPHFRGTTEITAQTSPITYMKLEE